MSIFIFWKDYDGAHIEEFEESEKAENRLGEILFQKNEYGTHVLLIVRGQKLDYEETVKVKAVHLKIKEK